MLTYEEWCQREIESARREVLDPVSQRLRCVEFISRSDGKGRKRPPQRWREICLVGDRLTGQHRDYKRFPFDQYAMEVYQGCGIHESEAGDRLREAVYGMTRLPETA